MTTSELDKILVIDDELGPRASIKMLFKGTYEVFTAESVALGLELLESEKPKILIMDIRMPNQTGIDGLREIRSRGNEIPVIMLTGEGDLKTAQEAIRLGALDYLTKPFDLQQMQETVARAMIEAESKQKNRRIAEELSALNDRLMGELGKREHLSELGQASSEIIHDLRNPLQVVRGYMSLLGEELHGIRDRISEESSDAFDYLRIIDKNLEHCSELSEMWVGLSKKNPDRFDRVDISEAVQDAVEGFLAVAPDYNAEITSNIDKECYVNADKLQIYRVISNFLINAAHALPSKDGKINVTCRRSGQAVAITVEDNGIGMTEDQKQRIFEPFYTSKKVQSGIGLGLFIAKRVIEEHQGQIEVTTTPEKGTTFTIRLPASAE